MLATPSYCHSDNAAKQNEAGESKSERRKSPRTFVLLQQNRLNIWKTPYCDLNSVFSARLSTLASQTSRDDGSPRRTALNCTGKTTFWTSVTSDFTRAAVDMDSIFWHSARLVPSTFFTLRTSDFENVQWCTELTDLFSAWSPETASTRWRPEDSCYPGEEAPCWGPQWLVLPWQAPGGGPGAPGFRTEGPSRQHLQAEQRQVSASLNAHIGNINQPS